MDIVSSSFEEIKLGRYEFWAGRDKCSTLRPPKISLKRSLLHQYIPYNPHPKKVPAKQNKTKQKQAICVHLRSYTCHLVSCINAFVLKRICIGVYYKECFIF